MNEQILEVLENRVTQLEKTCGINSENVAETIRGPSISQQITSLDEQLNRHLTDGTKKSLKGQLKKCKDTILNSD